MKLSRKKCSALRSVARLFAVELLIVRFNFARIYCWTYPHWSSVALGWAKHVLITHRQVARYFFEKKDRDDQAMRSAFFAPAGYTFFGWWKPFPSNMCNGKLLLYWYKSLIHVRYITSNATSSFVTSELRLRRNVREVGRARFRFLVNDNPVIGNFRSLLYTTENTAAVIRAYKSIFCTGEA
jgi:hypothetical protein